MKRILIVLMPLVFMLTISSCRSTVAVRPETPVVVQPARPGPNYVWVDGDWYRSGGTYTYKQGYWVVPKNNRTWAPGHWEKRRGGYYWQKGHWR